MHTSKLHITGPLWRESTDGLWIPLTMDSLMWRAFPWRDMHMHKLTGNKPQEDTAEHELREKFFRSTVHEKVLIHWSFYSVYFRSKKTQKCLLLVLCQRNLHQGPLMRKALNGMTYSCIFHNCCMKHHIKCIHIVYGSLAYSFFT